MPDFLPVVQGRATRGAPPIFAKIGIVGWRKTYATGDRAVTITFDFVAHQLVLQCSAGGTEAIPLEPRTVADFNGW